MKNKTNLLIISLLITIGLFIYLTVHHYSVQLGTNGPGLCSISSTLNCDAAAGSSYSEVFGIPIAVLGLCFNLIMLIVILFRKLGWSDPTKTQNGFVLGLFLTSAAVSIILGLISTFKIQVICPFCLGTYIFAFINAYLAWQIFKPASFNIAKILSEKENLISGGAILLLAWFISGSIQDKYGLNDIRQSLAEKVSLWQMSPVYTFNDSLGLTKNPQAAISVVEFADFKCPHCKAAAQSFKSFMKDRTDTKLVFKPFPLDGTCNPQVQFKGDGSRCKMATWALCSEKVAQKGWDVAYWYFENQESLMSVTNLKETNAELAKKFNFNYEDVEKCSESVTTYDEIKKIASEAVAAQVEGTPAIYLNGKKVEIRSEHLPIGLKAIINSIK